MFLIKFRLRIAIFASASLLTFWTLVGCTPVDNTAYEVNSAQVCDDSGITNTLNDDCKNASGYYAPMHSNFVYYRPYFQDQPIIIQRHDTQPCLSNKTPGGSFGLKNNIITNKSGNPLTNANGKVTTIPKSASTSTKPSFTPVRSSASFKAPSGIRINGGKISGGVVRGVGFSGSKGSVGG
jgi:hypothetical protein